MDRARVRGRIDALEEAILIPIVNVAFYAIDWWEEIPWYVRIKVRNTAIVLAILAAAVSVAR